MTDRRKVRRELLTILRQIPGWDLTLARWEMVGQILEIANKALAADDLESLEDVTAQLELVGPVRITRIGATPNVPPPAPVRERIGALIHGLSGGADDSEEEDG